MSQTNLRSAPLVYIVMPNKNGSSHLRYSLDSLFRTDYPNFRVVIVDNRSTDDSLRYASSYPEAEIVVNEEDKGFAGSVNRGVLHALSRGASYIAIYSNDIKVKPPWLQHSMGIFADNARAGILGYLEVPKEKDNEFLKSEGIPGTVIKAPALPGCLLLCSAEVFLRAGLMDEGYYMYGEDNDFFARIERAGLDLLQTDIPVWHYGEGSAAKRQLFPAWMAYRNAVRFSFKNRGLFGAARMTAALFYHGCLPHFGTSTLNPSLRRIRRYNPAVNFFLLAGSLGWNAARVISTIKARRVTGREKAKAAAIAAGKSLRIAIVNLTGGGISGGYLRYLENMIPRLSAMAGVEKVLCASPASTKISALFKETDKLELCDCFPGLPLWHHPDPALSVRLRTFCPDVIFVPIAKHLDFQGVPQVTMIQNMAPLKPQGEYPLRETFKMLLQRIEAKGAVLKAGRVIAMSRFVRDFLTGEWNIPGDKVATVYFGGGSPAATPSKPAALPEDLHGGFFFSAGSIEPYRGIEDILFAVSALKKKGTSVKVLVAGGTRPVVSAYGKKLRAIAKAEGIEDNIFWLGTLGAAEMNWCYSNCAAFVMTSRVESLAVITLEAMAKGCVCISGDSAPLPEAFGDAALYYPKADSGMLAEQMKRVLDMAPQQRDEISEKARLQAAKFSWEDTAKETLKVFREVIPEFTP